MNIVFEATNNHTISLETLWDIAKNYRLDYIYTGLSNRIKDCDSRYVTATDDYLDYFSSVLGKEYTFQDQPVFKDEISYSLLSQGWELFHYVARCQDTNLERTNTFKKYINIFNKDSAETVLEAVSGINNMDRSSIQKKMFAKIFFRIFAYWPINHLAA